LAIPELNSFDQTELNDNPVLNEKQPVPLIGALLMAEHLITREQLNACLLIQMQDHPNLPIGQILVRCGYISQAALDAALGIQNDMKSTMIDTIESRATPADMTALVLHARAGELAYAALSQLGVAATPARDWAEFSRALKDAQFDFVLIGADLLDGSTALPDQSTPLLLLPPAMSDTAGGFFLPEWARTLISHFVAQVRTQRRQNDARERL
jgi:hypothetical protein